MAKTAAGRRPLRNVTVTLDETLLRQARVRAAAEDKSLSAFLAGLLREKLVMDGEYRRALDKFLRQKPILSTGGKPLPKRNDLHDRALLRRR
jgi:hypothetical protein